MARVASAPPDMPHAGLPRRGDRSAKAAALPPIVRGCGLLYQFRDDFPLRDQVQDRGEAHRHQTPRDRCRQPVDAIADQHWHAAIASSRVEVPDLVSAAADGSEGVVLVVEVVQQDRGVGHCAAPAATTSATGPASGITGTRLGTRTAISRKAAPKTGSRRVTSVRRLPGMTVSTGMSGVRPWRRGSGRHPRCRRRFPAPDGRRRSPAGCGARRTPARTAAGTAACPTGRHSGAPGPDARPRPAARHSGRGAGRAARCTQHAEGKTRAVDGDHHGGPVRGDVGNGLAQAALQRPDLRQHLQQPHQCQLAHRKQAGQAMLCHLFAAYPGKAQAGAVRQQRGHQAAAEHIAAGLPGDQVDSG